MKNRGIYWGKCKIQETLYTGQRHLRPFKVGTLGPHTVLPITVRSSSYFLESHRWSETSSLSKVILAWGKPEVAGHHIWAVGELSHLGQNLMFCQKTHHKAWCMGGQTCCHDKAASQQLPIAAAFWILWMVSPEKCSSLRQTLMKIYCSTCSVILNVTATQHRCSLNGTYRSHWLVQ